MANFEYPQAGVSAPPGVQATVQQFRRLPMATKRKLPLLYYVLGSGTSPYKMDPIDAAYANRTPKPGQTCGNCRHSYQHVKSGSFICDQLSNAIQPQAWCALWSA